MKVRTVSPDVFENGGAPNLDACEEAWTKVILAIRLQEEAQDMPLVERPRFGHRSNLQVRITGNKG